MPISVASSVLCCWRIVPGWAEGVFDGVLQGFGDSGMRERYLRQLVRASANERPCQGYELGRQSPNHCDSDKLVR